MLKFYKILLFALLIHTVATGCINSYASDAIAVNINNQPIQFDTQPCIIEGRVFVPMRKIFEELGASVDWNGPTQTVTAKYSDINIKIKVDDCNATRNDEIIQLDVPAKLIEGRTVVPIRFIGESFGAKVNWDEVNKLVSVNIDLASGNSAGNIINLGYAAKQGDWVYISSYKGNGLWKMNLNDNKATQIIPNNVSFINIVGDWIYCNLDSDGKTSEFQNLGLHRIKTDGSIIEKLGKEGYVSYISVLGNWIYYSDFRSRIPYRILLDGSKYEKLSDYGFANLNINSDGIYMTNDRVRRMNLDGTNHKTLFNLENAFYAEHIIADGNWVYMLRHDWSDKTKHGLFKIKKDGTDLQRISGESVRSFNVKGDYVYYTVYSEDKLYRIKGDGLEKKKISDQSPLFITIIDDWIFYSEDDRIYKVKSDGSEKWIGILGEEFKKLD